MLLTSSNAAFGVTFYSFTHEKLDPEPPLCLFVRTELCERETLKIWLAQNKENRKRKEVAAWFKEVSVLFVLR